MSPSESPTPAENAEKLRVFVERIGPGHEVDALPAYVHEGIVLPADIPPAGRQGIDGIRDHLMFMKGIFEHEAAVQDIVAAGDKVAARVRISGNQIGDAMGIPNEGRAFAVDEFLIAQFRDGKIERLSRVIDLLSLQAQLRGGPEPHSRAD